jgi:hypothetical protein
MKNFLTILFFLLTTSGTALAGMDPQTYFEIEIRARQLTLESMEQRLACMKNGCPLPEQYAIDEECWQRILGMHSEYSITPSRLSGWYSNHMNETEGYLLSHPRLKLQLDDLDTSFETFSDAITTIREAQ